MKSRVGEVWDVSWGTYPRQILLVVGHEGGILTTLDLETAELELLPAELIRADNAGPYSVRLA